MRRLPALDESVRRHDAGSHTPASRSMCVNCSIRYGCVNSALPGFPRPLVECVAVRNYRIVPTQFHPRMLGLSRRIELAGLYALVVAEQFAHGLRIVPCPGGRLDGA